MINEWLKRKAALFGVVDDLGPVDAARYIRSYNEGHGDYTKDRKKWLSNDFDSVVLEMNAKRE
ncbi:MAG: hypothetical protein GXY48_13405 [Methanomicrobiales archaeon]|nr:hypothetical protein [Methanomicrobiales archaeon]